MNKQQSDSSRQGIWKWSGRAIVLTVVILMTGCATVPQAEPGGNPEQRNIDPFEPVNRSHFQFNRDVDRAILKPVADAYVKVTPRPVRTSVSNFFDNLGYLNVILNGFLQGKVRQGFADTGRFVVNSTVGILGLFDVAGALGMEEHDEDFGQTLGVWGVGEGAYLVYPLLGPNTLRDSPDLGTSLATNPLFYVGQAAITAPLAVLGIIDARARAIGAFEFIEEVALDPYIFTREAYLQRRVFLIFDGDPPLPEFFDDWDNEDWDNARESP